ncbi:MAG: CapA family protein [Cyanobacteriota bacterium]|nr:CapA family protein [Cyanobacteriota bacterium]
MPHAASLGMALALVLPLTGCHGWSRAFQEQAVLEGRVLDLDGNSVASAVVTSDARSTRTTADGRFTLTVPSRPGWLSVRAAGHLPALRPVLPGSPAIVRLSSDDGETVVIRVGGDVMAGRRFYTPEPGSRQNPLLVLGDSGPAHRALLSSVKPLLQQADLTLLNLESPLLADPIAEWGAQRSAAFHSSKDHVFASGPGLAMALQQAGVDLLGLANNHVYDALEPGLRSTLLVLHQAGFLPGQGYFGAGFTSAQAWRPAVHRLKGMQISILGCTTIHGAQHPISYVASDVQRKGGAALCEPAVLQQAVQQARRRGLVVVMIHGGNEYQVEPTEPMTQAVALARSAGASLILNHHPHVTGGLHWDGTSLVADSLGNFLFDQTLWNTFPSLLLEVQLSRGRIRRVTGYPLLLHGYRPHAAVGDLADWIVTGLLTRRPGPWLLESGVLEADLRGRAGRTSAWHGLTPAAGRSSGIWRISSAARFCGARGSTGLELGRDLLGVGGFEDQLVGSPAGLGAQWILSHRDQRLEPGAARRGRYGVRLRRQASHRQPVLLRPLHRLPVRPGERLSLLLWVRGAARSAARLQISWYESRRGPSRARLIRPITLDPGGRWQPVRLDLEVPSHTVAVGVAVALDPPRFGRAQLDLDDLALVHWQTPAQAARQGPTHLRVTTRGAAVCLASATLPGVGPGRGDKVLTDWPQPAN